MRHPMPAPPSRDDAKPSSLGGSIPKRAWVILGMLLMLAAFTACAGKSSTCACGPVPTAPTFIVQPADQTVALGASATFTATISSGTPPSYQWKRNGVDIAGATNASYTLPMATTADAGTAFSLMATNAGGAATSRSAVLTVSNPTVPAEFADLYPALQTPIGSFNQAVSTAWNGQKSSVAFGGELPTANANQGRKLLSGTALTSVRLELDRLKALGLQSVTVCMGFPVLYGPFHTWNGNPSDAAAFLGFYQSVATEIHNRDMKMIVESSLLFPGVYSSGSGFNLSGYYATLSVSQLTAAHSAMLAALATQVRPDWINLGSEPDTQATLFNNPSLNTPSGFASLIAAEVAAIHAAGSTVPLGAGVGTWQSNAASYLPALAATGIDYFDLHVYPVNLGFLDKLTTLTDAALAYGKPVAISEAWLSKERDSEFTQYNAATDQTIFSRDAFAFWAPLDQAFLGALVKFAHWKHLLYLSPFWTTRFHAYVDYQPGLSPAQITDLGNQAASAAMQAGTASSTGVCYGSAIK